MRSMHAVLAVLFAAALSTPANASEPAWTQEPREFRGIAFGATEREVASQLKLDAVACLEIEGQRTCLHHGALGDVRVSEIYTFEDDKFVQVHISFKPDRHPLLIGQFVKEYGKAGETWTEPFEAIGGGEHTNEIHVWNGDNMVIQVEKFGPSLVESSAVIATRAWYDKTAEE
jgi:hypothetical protein